MANTTAFYGTGI